jgi:hypothetical protein
MSWLRKRDLSWKDIGEKFTRWELRTPWGSVLLHRMHAPVEHQHFHDHPWNFWSIVLWGGYSERIRGAGTEWRGAGSIRYRRAECAHKTTTYDRVSWSLCFTGPKIREWRGDLT